MTHIRLTSIWARPRFKAGTTRSTEMLTRDLPETDRIVQVGEIGSFDISLPMRSNDVVLVTLEKVTK